MFSIEKFLEGQSAIVTGGSPGIGAACALELARQCRVTGGDHGGMTLYPGFSENG